MPGAPGRGGPRQSSHQARGRGAGWGGAEVGRALPIPWWGAAQHIQPIKHLAQLLRDGGDGRQGVRGDVDGL